MRCPNWFCKMMAKRYYRKMCKLIDGYPCGWTLALEVVPEAEQMRRKAQEWAMRDTRFPYRGTEGGAE